MVEHDLDVVGGVPVAVVIKAAGQCNCGMRSADCGIIGVGQLGKLFQIVAAINDAGVEEAAGALRRSGERRWLPAFEFYRRTAVRRYGNLFCHARSLGKRCAAVNSPGQESAGWTFSGSLFRAVKLSQLSRPGSFTAFFPAATAP